VFAFLGVWMDEEGLSDLLENLGDILRAGRYAVAGYGILDAKVDSEYPFPVEILVAQALIGEYEALALCIIGVMQWSNHFVCKVIFHGVLMTEHIASDRTVWMSGHYGLMCHWLFPGVMPKSGEPARTLDEAVDHFNTIRLMEDIEATGAEWLIFTLGQNTGCYVSPNALMDALAGKGHCSQRDLILEIATALHQRGKRFIAYLPCEVRANTGLHQGFAWNAQEGTDQAEFQRLYTNMVEEWALRFGDLLDGWWFDGCYTWPIFHSKHMNWPLWFRAARGGNPKAALAFNDGSFCVGNLQPVIPELDYLSGEVETLIDGRIRLDRQIDGLHTHLPTERFVPGTKCQWHALLPVDSFWMHGARIPSWLPGHRFMEVPAGVHSAPMEPPVYPDEELASFLKHCLSVGGAVTFNAGIYEEGYLGQETVRQLRRIQRELSVP
jgi:hypothetical protein